MKKIHRKDAVQILLSFTLQTWDCEVNVALHLSVDLFVSIVGKGSFKSNCSRRHNMERRDKQIDSNHLSRTPLNKGTHDML